MSTKLRRMLLLLVVAAITTGIIVVVNQPKPKLGPPCTVAIGTETVGLTVEQAENATTIAAVAARMNLANHAVTIAFATAFQESRLSNLDYGDLDSLGIFQQRPSQGWGTAAQIMVPRYAATAFFTHLARVPNWENLSVNDAAQQVQHSGVPDAYGQWEAQARLLARALTGEVPASFSCRQTVTKRVDAVSALEPDLVADAGTPTIGVTVAAARGWLISSWLVAHAAQYGVFSVTFAGQQWKATTDSWESIVTSQSVVRVNQQGG